jgi:hypothetical protein
MGELSKVAKGGIRIKKYTEANVTFTSPNVYLPSGVTWGDICMMSLHCTISGYDVWLTKAGDDLHVALTQGTGGIAETYCSVAKASDTYFKVPWPTTPFTLTFYSSKIWVAQ